MGNPSRSFEFLRLSPGLSADPGSGLPGEIYYNSTSNSLRFFNGSLWADFGGVWADQQLSNLTGTTAIPVDLLPVTTLTKNIGSSLLVWNSISVSTINNVANISDVTGNGINISTDANTGSLVSGDLTFLTGNTVNGPSGSIQLATGVPSGTGTRGLINISALSIRVQGQTPLEFMDSTSTNFVALKAPATISAPVTWTLPNADGTSGYALTTNGSGQLGWSTITSGSYVLKAGDTMTGTLNLPLNGLNVNSGQLQATSSFQVQLKGILDIIGAGGPTSTGYLNLTTLTSTAYIGIDASGLMGISSGDLLIGGPTAAEVFFVVNSTEKFRAGGTVNTTSQAIVPSAAATLDLGSTSLYFNTVWSSAVTRQAQLLVGSSGATLPSGATSGYGINDNGLAQLGTMAIWSQSNALATANPTGTVRVETGNKTAGSGNSGDIKLRIGTSSGGTRGSVYLADGTESLGAGAVWTLQDTAGRGMWVASSIPTGVTPRVEYRTLSSGEITAKALTLAHTPFLASNTLVDALGGDSQIYAVDYTVSSATLSWSGLGLDGALIAGDVLRIVYWT